MALLDFETDSWGEMKLVRVSPLAWVLGVVGLLLVLLLISVVLSIKTISPGQAAVSTRFGELNGVRSEGVYVALFEGYTIYDLRAKQVAGRYDGGSKEGQFIYVDLAFSYSLKADDLGGLYSKVGDQQGLEDKFIKPTLVDVTKQVTAQYSANEILVKQAEFRGKIFDEIKSRMNQDYINIIDIQVTNIDFTPEYNKALEDKQVKQQELEKNRYALQQLQETATAELEREKTYAQQRIVQAQSTAEAQRLLQSTLTPGVIQKMWIEKWDGKLPTTMTGDSNVLLPLK